MGDGGRNQTCEVDSENSTHKEKALLTKTETWTPAKKANSLNLWL